MGESGPGYVLMGQGFLFSHWEQGMEEHRGVGLDSVG